MEPAGGQCYEAVGTRDVRALLFREGAMTCLKRALSALFEVKGTQPQRQRERRRGAVLGTA